MQGEGHINVADVRGHYSKCIARTFTSSGDLNKFFEDNPHRLVVGMWQVHDGVMVLYTGVVDEKEIRAIQRFGEEIRKKIAEEDAAADKLREEQEENARKQEAERKRLVEVGRKCEEHHAKLVEEARKERKGKK